jgi:hypothetical protein
MAVLIIAVIAIKTVYDDGVLAVLLLVIPLLCIWHAERSNRHLCGKKHAWELDFANNCIEHIYNSCAKEAATKRTAQDICNCSFIRPSTSLDGDVTNAKMLLWQQRQHC